jgi:hypothetical protein
VTLGQYDIVVVTEFPDDETAAAVALQTDLGNVRTTTMQAFDAEQVGAIIQRPASDHCRQTLTLGARSLAGTTRMARTARRRESSAAWSDAARVGPGRCSRTAATRLSLTSRHKLL